MVQEPMSDQELARRKRLQARYSKTGSTLGLGALALKGASYGASAYPKASKLKILRKLPVVSAEKLTSAGKKLSEAATTSAIGASGVGGIGGYNFAAYTREEGRRNQAVKAKPQKVSKAMESSAFGVIQKNKDEKMETVYRLRGKTKAERTKERAKTGITTGALSGGLTFGLNASKSPAHLIRAGKASGVAALAGGAVGAALPPKKYKLERIEKPRVAVGVSKVYDPEERRIRRSGEAMGITAAGSGALGYGATRQGQKARAAYKASKGSEAKAVRAINQIRVNAQGQALTNSIKSGKQKAAGALREGGAMRLKALSHGKTAAALGAGAIATGATSAGMSRKANKRGRTYQAWYSD